MQHAKTVANLPRGMSMDDITLAEAVALLADKGKALKPRGAAGRKGKAPARKAAARTAPADGAKSAPAPSAGAKKAAPRKKAAAKTGTKAAAKVPRRAAE